MSCRETRDQRPSLGRHPGCVRFRLRLAAAVSPATTAWPLPLAVRHLSGTLATDLFVPNVDAGSRLLTLGVVACRWTCVFVLVGVGM